jgi:hypothetical protein
VRPHPAHSLPNEWPPEQAAELAGDGTSIFEQMGGTITGPEMPAAFPDWAPYAVVLGSHLPYHASACWGPFASLLEAEKFARYVTAEIDPAQVMRLLSPAGELLNWYAFADERAKDAGP